MDFFKDTTIIFISVFGALVFFMFCFFFYQLFFAKDYIISPRCFDQQKIFSALITTPQEIEDTVKQALKNFDRGVVKLVSAPKNTIDTIFMFDYLAALSEASIYANILEALSFLSPDEAIRTMAQQQKVILSTHIIKQLMHNKEVYTVILATFERITQQENLSKIEQYCIQTVLEEFQRDGIHLSADEQKKLAELLQKIEEHSINFTQNISAKRDTIEVSKEELSGLPSLFIASLSQTESGNYILTTDYPIYFTVMESCTNQETRKKLYHAFFNRAFPDNERELANIIGLRAELAQLLGFSSYAAYDLGNQMAKKESSVKQLLSELLEKTEEKVQRELALLRQEALEANITLSSEGKFNPWDTAFLINEYKKKQLSLDENVLAEYFPVEHTLPALFSLYEQFFGITFQQEELSVIPFAEDVTCMVVIEQRSKKKLGYLLLDLYPRQHKYSHAAHLTLVPATILSGDTETVPVSIVMANFPQKTDLAPALLKRSDVQTFFHELGHALHALFGKTTFASFSGTKTKCDFVETPSQMLEEWLYDPQVLTRISKHYKTGASLSDETISQIIKSKNTFMGLWLQRQTFLALLSLAYYEKNLSETDLFGIMKGLYQTISPEIAFYDHYHVYASFGHLTGYGAKYYSYVYSKIFALDLFESIKADGIFETSTGIRYKNTILAPGGSQDPEKLLETFLGRKPSVNALIRDCCY